MIIESLGIINRHLQALGINYEFGEWSKEPIYPYFVGTYSEDEALTEDGEQDATFTLDGFTRGKMLELEQAKATIREGFEDFIRMTDSGSAVVVSYGNSFPIPTGDDELKRIQINLKIKEWKV